MARGEHGGAMVGAAALTRAPGGSIPLIASIPGSGADRAHEFMFKGPPERWL